MAWNAATLIPAHPPAASLLDKTGSAFPSPGPISTPPTVPCSTLLATAGENQVAYLRGDRSREQSNGGLFRSRSDLLGDIINSDPVYVGSRDYGYGSAASLTQAERDGYLIFLGSTAIRSRTPMLYVGANDGMLHGFRVANGVETLAYIPASLLGI